MREPDPAGWIISIKNLLDMLGEFRSNNLPRENLQCSSHVGLSANLCVCMSVRFSACLCMSVYVK